MINIWNGVALSLLSTIEDLLATKSIGSVLETPLHGQGEPLR
jgi:hypothetical protein